MNQESNTPEQEQNTSEKPNEPKGHPFLIIALAVVVLFVLSLMPWSKWTAGKISDFNLLSDLFPVAESDTTSQEADSVLLDPELELLAEEFSKQTYDTISTDSTVRLVVAETAPRVDGEMIIEDYTPLGTGMAHLKAALERRSYRPVRIGVIGDSYIEGDIFTQDIRRLLQEQYGGRGVGYVPAFSETSGFRRSVNHKSSGWTEHDLRKSTSDKFPLSGQYFSGGAGATFTFSGTSRIPNLDRWSRSKVMFIAPNGGKITLSLDTLTQTFDVVASADSVQCLELQGAASRFTLKSSAPGLKVLGAWLEDGAGVVVDNMSLRGDSGMSHRRVSSDITEQMRQYVDYDLIVMEYGINALSEKQKDYTNYRKAMVQVAEHLKKCYPNADIVLMGIGDRGVKKNGVYQSISTAPAMVAAQRGAARDAGILFWDTREAMGGEGAIVDWRTKKLVNGDYIHLNSDGGKRLAEEFVKSLNRSLK